MTAAGEVVVLRALGLGDLLTSLPALRALRGHYPNRRLVLLAPAPSRDVLELARLDLTLVDWRGLDGIPAGEPAVAVNLHGSGPESHRLLVAMRPQSLIAFAHPPLHTSGPEWDPAEHEVRRWCRLLREHGIEADPTDLGIEPPPTVSKAVGVTVIHPGAKDAARRWPVSRWAQVAAHEVAAGREVMITGTPQERPAALAVAELAGVPPASVLAGETTLRALAAVLASAGMLVCGDTGVAHLATALGTASVLLFGPTDPARWGPPLSARHTVLWKGRTGDPHASVPDPGLLEITPGEVIEALERLRESTVPQG